MTHQAYCLMAKEREPSRQNLRWVIESGETSHMNFAKNAFDNFKKLSPFDVCIGRHKVHEKGRDSIKVKLDVDSNDIDS